MDTKKPDVKVTVRFKNPEQDKVYYATDIYYELPSRPGTITLSLVQGMVVLISQNVLALEFD